MFLAISPTFSKSINSRNNLAKPISYRGFNKKSEISEEKNKLPAILLTGLSLAIGLFAYIKLRKSQKVLTDAAVKKLEEAQIYLKNIFGKDFAIDDANNFVRKHEELIKIKDNKEYYLKLFEQLKRDFKVENKSLSLELMDKPIPVNNGEYRGYTEALTRKIGATSSQDRISTISNLFHEFKHVKQNELMYKTDSKRLVNIKVAELEKSNNASWQRLLKDCGGDKELARKTVQKEVEQVYAQIWGHLKPVSKTSENYKLGIKYLENEANRIPPGAHYYEQILEKEARFVEENAVKLFKLFEM